MQTELADLARYPTHSTSLERGKQSFHHPRTSLGVAGHWIHLAAVISPLVIGELISDPGQRWRAIRLSSAAAAVASEAIYTHRLLQQRELEKEHER